LDGGLGITVRRVRDDDPVRVANPRRAVTINSVALGRCLAADCPVWCAFAV